jgi:hypothetical protein
MLNVRTIAAYVHKFIGSYSLCAVFSDHAEHALLTNRGVQNVCLQLDSLDYAVQRLKQCCRIWVAIFWSFRDGLIEYFIDKVHAWTAVLRAKVILTFSSRTMSSTGAPAQCVPENARLGIDIALTP